jgi:hypothetical protein
MKLAVRELVSSPNESFSWLLSSLLAEQSSQRILSGGWLLTFVRGEHSAMVRAISQLAN